MNELIKSRAVILFYAFIVLFAGLAGRLVFIQVFSAERLGLEALSQQSSAVSLEIPARGLILDRKLRPITEPYLTWRPLVFPVAVKDIDRSAADLAPVLGLTADSAKSFLKGEARVLPFDLNQSQVNSLNETKITGVIPVQVMIRSRKPDIAEHIIGYLGRENPSKSWEGKMGIESVYDEILRSNKPERVARIFLDGKRRFVEGLGYRIEKSTDHDRKNIVTTIDRDIQEIAERVLDQSGVTEGAAAVIDLRNGDILALASRPHYGLETRQDQDSFVNNCLSAFQPGSVFKVVVAAAALEKNIVKPDDQFLCTGKQDEIVKCYKEEGHGLITFAEGLIYSCNPVFARVGLKLGPDLIIEYARKFGIGNMSITGYKEAEEPDNLQRIAEKYNLVNSSLGQWPVEANVIQITAMMATIANGGTYIPPRLVKEIRYNNGEIFKVFPAEKGKKVIENNTASLLEILLEMTTKSGTGKHGYVEVWGSAGKTGSAQVGSGKINAWFSGFAPAGKPEYAVTVMVKDGESGGSTAAPIFREIIKEIMALEGK